MQHWGAYTFFFWFYNLIAIMDYKNFGSFYRTNKTKTMRFILFKWLCGMIFQISADFRALHGGYLFKGWTLIRVRRLLGNTCLSGCLFERGAYSRRRLIGAIRCVHASLIHDWDCLGWDPGGNFWSEVSIRPHCFLMAISMPNTLCVSPI